MIQCATILNSLGLATVFFGSILLYRGTWAYEPTPSMDVDETAKSAHNFAGMVAIQNNLSPSETSDYVGKTINEALCGATVRNRRREGLNRNGLRLLILGFFLQFSALWVN